MSKRRKHKRKLQRRSANLDRFVIVGHEVAPELQPTATIKYLPRIQSQSQSGYQTPKFLRAPKVSHDKFKQKLSRLVTALKKNRLIIFAARLLQAGKDIIAALTFKYAFKNFFYASIKLFTSEQKGKYLLRIILPLLFAATLITIGTILLPGVGTMFATALGITSISAFTFIPPLLIVTVELIVEYVGLGLAGMIIGGFAAKHLSRLYNKLRHGDTNPEKYFLRNSSQQKLIEDGMDYEIMADLAQYLRHKTVNTRSVLLGLQNPFRAEQTKIYKQAYKQLQKGNAAYANELLQDKLAKYDRKISHFTIKFNNKFSEDIVTANLDSYKIIYNSLDQDYHQDPVERSDLTRLLAKDEQSYQQDIFNLWQLQHKRNDFRERFFRAETLQREDSIEANLLPSL